MKKILLFTIIAFPLYINAQTPQPTPNSTQQQTKQDDAPAQPSPEISSPQNPTPDESTKKKTFIERAKFGVYSFVSTANRIRFGEVIADNGTETASGSIYFNAQPALGVAFEISFVDTDSWGANFGVSYDDEREIKSTDISFAGEEAHYDYMAGPKFSIITAYGNAIYRWSKWYLPFGGNLSLPTFTSKPAGFKMDMRGGVGFQAGAGIQFTEWFALEAIARALVVQATGANSTLTYDYGSGLIGGVNLNAKFSF